LIAMSSERDNELSQRTARDDPHWAILRCTHFGCNGS
jgi:hypothetical protein